MGRASIQPSPHATRSPPNPCAPAVSVPVPVPVLVPPRTPLRLPAVNTPLPQVNCAALWKAIHTRSGRSPSRPTGTTSCPDRMTRRSGSGTPHRVCLHIRRRAYVAYPVSVSFSRECTSPLGPAQGCRTVGACLSVGACARVRVCVCLRVRAGAEVGVGRASIQPSPNTTRSPPTPAPPRCPSPSLSLSLSLSPHAPPSACPPSTHLFHRSTAPHSARPFRLGPGGRHRAQRGLHRVRIG